MNQAGLNETNPFSFFPPQIDTKTAEALMNYPTVNISIDRKDLHSSFGNLLLEYKRFKKIQLSGAETSGK